MKIIKQFGIIFSLCWIATVIEELLPIAFPAGVIAMLLLLLCLMTGVLKIDHLREKSAFLWNRPQYSDLLDRRKASEAAEIGSVQSAADCDPAYIGGASGF